MATKSAGARSPRWAEWHAARLVHAVVIALANQAALVVPLVVIAPLILGDQDPFAAPPGAFLLLAIIAFLQAAIVVGLGLLRVGRVSLEALGWRAEGWTREALRGVVGFATIALILVGLRAVHGGAEAAMGVVDAVLGYSAPQRALLFFIGLIAAFSEESIFRGYLQPALTNRFGSAVGIVVTATFFAAYHLQFAPLRLLSLTLIGLVYGVLRGRDRSLVASGVAHALCWAVLGAI